MTTHSQKNKYKDFANALFFFQLAKLAVTFHLETLTTLIEWTSWLIDTFRGLNVTCPSETISIGELVIPSLSHTPTGAISFSLSTVLSIVYTL